MKYVEYPEAMQVLADWEQCWCETWDYTVSHGVLRLKLSRIGDNACAVLVLKNCRSVSFSSSWNSSGITVQPTRKGDEVRYLVSDSDHLRVDCGAVFVSPKLLTYAEIPERWHA
jgi:hypothetical protein